MCILMGLIIIFCYNEMRQSYSIIAKSLFLYVQKSRQKPPDSERLPPHQQSLASSAAPPTTQNQPISSAAYKKINLGRQSVTHMRMYIYACMYTHTHMHDNNTQEY